MCGDFEARTRISAWVIYMKRGGDRIGLGTHLGMGDGGRLYPVYRSLRNGKAGWDGAVSKT
jgi:hypothetical protein